MVGIDEQRRAAAMTAEDFHQLAISSLAELEAAATFRQARAQHAQLAKAAHDVLGNLGIVIDLGGVDLLFAELAQIRDQRARLQVGRDVRIGKQAIAEILAEEQPLGESQRGPPSPSNSSASATCFSRLATLMKHSPPGLDRSWNRKVRIISERGRLDMRPVRTRYR